MVSISLSIGEYSLSKHLLDSELVVTISFEAKCQDFVTMKSKTFKSNVVFNQEDFVGGIGKIFKCQTSSIERLRPIHTKNSLSNVQSIAKTLSFKLTLSNPIQQCYGLQKQPTILD